MKKISVVYKGWGNCFDLGTLADDGKELLFEYSPERFEGMRVPMHTAAGAAHVDFRYPQLDYINLLRLTRRMTTDEREVLQAFERCVFNVVFNNRDDHSKNFSFLFGQDGRWQFSPAYDLTYCVGPSGEHQMDIAGEAREPARKHLLYLAKKGGVPEKTAVDSIERIAEVASRFREFPGVFSIRHATVKEMEAAVTANRDRMS